MPEIAPHRLIDRRRRFPRGQRQHDYRIGEGFFPCLASWQEGKVVSWQSTNQRGQVQYCLGRGLACGEFCM